MTKSVLIISFLIVIESLLQSLRNYIKGCFVKATVIWLNDCVFIMWITLFSHWRGHVKSPSMHEAEYTYFFFFWSLLYPWHAQLCAIHHWNLINFNCTISFAICVRLLFSSLWLVQDILATKGPLEFEQLIGFIAFLAATNLLPPWLQPPYSVWAVPLLPPVTLGNRAKLWLARPYGLSLTKYMTERLYLLTQ